MIAIYKELPKTNCGKCGVPTCMAFAVMVMNGRQKITECPFIAKKDNEPVLQKAAITMDDNYERVSNELEANAKCVNFEEIAAAVGGSYEKINGCETIRLAMFNRPFEMRREGLFENDAYCHDSWSKIIIYDYIRRGGSRPLSGDWITL